MLPEKLSTDHYTVDELEELASNAPIKRMRPKRLKSSLVRGFAGMDVGSRLRVRLIHTDVERGFIDFGNAG